LWRHPKDTGAKTSVASIVNKHPDTKFRRIFLAFPIPDPLRNYVEAVQSLLRAAGVRGRWTRPGNLHVTAVFLGEHPDNVLPVLSKHLAVVMSRQPALELTCDRINSFTWPPKLLHLTLRDTVEGRFLQCAQTLMNAVEAVGIRLGPEVRRRHPIPHVTLVRFHISRDLGRLRSLATFRNGQIVWRDESLAIPDPGDIRIPCREINLYESRLGPAGAVYRVLDSFKLAAPPPSGA